MAESSWQPVMGAAQRRRKRRLRSWWRHEQQSIAAALERFAMSERVGAAKRRRDRRLRAWHRYEQLTVAMELAAALHHSAQRPKTVVDEPKEEVENVTRDGLRAQKSPPPGERPAPLSEVARPQRSDRQKEF